MAVNMGPAFELAVAKLAGIDPTSYYPGSLEIVMINPDEKAETMVRFTAQAGVPTTQLKALIVSALSPA